MNESARNPAEAVGPLLAHLLSRHSQYRRTWQAQVRRGGPKELNIAAVAHVIAFHLWDVGARGENEHDLPRKIKDRVRRALNGEVLSPETLDWFVGAFNMSQDDEEHLWNAYAGIETGVRSRDEPWFGSMRNAPRLVLPQRHRTLAAFELVTVDHRGTITSKHVRQVIQAMDNGVARFPVSYDERVKELRVLAGGVVGETLSHGHRLRLSVIELEAPLEVGQTQAVEYRAIYPSEVFPATEVRRTVRNRVENLDLKVAFAGARRPRHIAWTVWDSPLGRREVAGETIDLNADHVAHRFVPTAYGTVVGFRWDW